MVTVSLQVIIQVVPFRVYLFNESNLPGTLPLFDLLFSNNGVSNVPMCLVVDKTMNRVSLREPLYEIMLMLPHPFDQLAGDAGVECPVPSAGENVNIAQFEHQVF